MTVEQLLEPRYEVIADYPGSPFSVGNIIYFEQTGESENDYYTMNCDPFSWIEKPCNYPHLFKHLAWWEKRSESDMPEYVKLEFNNKVYYVHKAESWKGFNSYNQPLYEYYNKVNYLSKACVSDLLPATEAEYLTYTQKHTTP